MSNPQTPGEKFHNLKNLFGSVTPPLAQVVLWLGANYSYQNSKKKGENLSEYANTGEMS